MPVDVTDKYIRIRVREPGDFQEGSFRTITLDAKQGIRAVIGRPKGKDTTEVQSYLFDKENWDTKRAKAWVARHKEEKKAVDETQFLDIDGENVSIAGLVEAYKAANVSLDEQARQIRDAWYMQFRPRPPQPSQPEPWIKELFDDFVIVEVAGDLFRYPYTLDDEGQPEFGTPEKVEMIYQPVMADKKAMVQTRYAVKALREDGGGLVVGGYLLLWGDPKHRDLGKDYFTKSTELWLDRYPTVPALFHHGLDQDVGLTVVGHRVKSVPDDTGVWVEDWLDKSNKYWSLIKPLLDAERLYYSPGSAPHLIRREQDGELKAFPVVEDTFTPIPMQHRLLPVEQVRAAYKSANLVLPAELLEGRDGGGDGGPSRQSELEALKAKIEVENFLLTLSYFMEV